MNRKDRAKQFAPFDALKGLREALLEKEVELEKVERHQITEELQEKIQPILARLNKGDEVGIRYYEGGFYKIKKGKVMEMDSIYKIINIEGKKIHFEDIIDISN